MNPAQLSLEEFERDVEYTTARGSGPGGQHRNKTETAVRAIHSPTGLQAQAGERRSQAANKREALKRLRLRVAVEFRIEVELVPPGIYEPSELWQSRRVGKKIVVSRQHEDFPALLAEALDVLEHTENDVPRASALLEISTSQFIKFLAKAPEALGRVNDARRKRGLKPYTI